MKHIFYVHSGITYLVSLAAIAYLKLQPDEIRMVISRSIQIDDQFQNIILEPEEQAIAQLPSYGSVGVLKNLLVLRRLDRKINEASNDKPFTLYLPSERNYLMQFLQSHRLCVARNFIEEGLLTYRAGFIKPRPALNSFMKRLHHFLRFPFHLYRSGGVTGHHVGNDFTIYVVTETARDVLHAYNTVLLDISNIATDQALASKTFTSLYIFDAVVEMDLCAEDNFMVCLENFIATQVPREDLMIKFHPFQKSHDQYLELFDRYNIKYEILGREIIPETLLAQKKGLSVYGLSSSVLFYAKEMGHDVYSFSPQLANQDKRYLEYVSKSIPISIIDYLKLI